MTISWKRPRIWLGSAMNGCRSIVNNDILASLYVSHDLDIYYIEWNKPKQESMCHLPGFILFSTPTFLKRIAIILYR
jgi:hypothetical protein